MIDSLGSINQYNQTNFKLTKLLNQVETGKRINTASDDASGLVIADNLKLQADSLGSANKNIRSAISLLNVADVAVTSFKEILSEIKDKTITAATDVNSSESRRALQNDVNRLMKTLNFTAKNTSFNGIKLLNGTFSNKSFQIGAYSGQTTTLTIGSLEASKIGHLTKVDFADVSVGTTAATLAVNNETVGQVTVSATSKSGADLVAESINVVSVESGVVAKGVNDLTGTSVVAGSLVAGDLVINGIEVGEVNFMDNDSSGTLVDAINAVSSQSGVTASLDAGKLKLTTENGENIHITDPNTAADFADTGLTAGTNYGHVELTSMSAISVVNGTAVSGGNATTSSNYTLSDVNLMSESGAQIAMDIIDNALSESNSIASQIGSSVTQMNRTKSVNEVTQANVKAAESTIRDADIAEVMEKLNQLQLRAQMSLYSLAKIQEVNSGILAILR